MIGIARRHTMYRVSHEPRPADLRMRLTASTLPGIQEAALAMPDFHEGYGFPIGGVAATSYPDGLISPGGIGYDINCGVRLLSARVPAIEVEPHLEELCQELFR